MTRCSWVGSLCLTVLVGTAAQSAFGAREKPVGLITETRRDGQAIQQLLPEGAIEIRAVSRNSVLARRTFFPSRALDVIVQFRAAPIARARSRGLDLESSHSDYRSFLSDLPALEAALPPDRDGSRPAARLRRRFETSFNGVALSASRELVDRLRSLPYVSGVFPDDTVRAVLSESVPLIRADSVRLQFGVAGEGIEVSIIDTGIDYMHPALGGCFGPTCRVKAGYDFVNLDSDPRDDHGHGTHVAGIVGANGVGITGVAPAVRFHAYKVLAYDGYGIESDVIAALDRSLDPDQDPLTDDAVDVINLSLSASPASPHDPMSQAVDQVVEAGVVCVVAAGNSGDYFTIGSPGTARRAITVGATTKTDETAWFTSGGPSLPDYDIKPDIVAPGVDIMSSWLGGGTEILSGTSMATPHVVGTVALLRQLHPTWSPEVVKATLMNNTITPTVGPFLVGPGRIDALAAARSDLVVTPGSLSFGLIPVVSPTWVKAETLHITNLASSTRMVTLSVMGLGSRLSVSPSAFSLGAGQTQDVIATLTINQSTFPYRTAPPYGYWGQVWATCEGTTRRVPFAVLKARQITFTSDTPNILALLHDRASYYSVLTPNDSIFRAFVPAAGTFDIIASVGINATVIREGIVVVDSAAASIRTTDAIHKIERFTIGEQGQTVATPDAIEWLAYKPTGLGFLSFGGAWPTQYFSPASTSYLWEWTRHTVDPDPTLTYAFHGYLLGIDGPRTFQNAPGDLQYARTEYRLDPNVQQHFPMHYFSDGPLGRSVPGGNIMHSISWFFPTIPPLTTPLPFESYFMAAPSPEFRFRSWYKAMFPYVGVPFSPFDADPFFAMPFMVAEPQQPLRGYIKGEGVIPAYSPPDDGLRSGFGPPTWFGRFINRTDSLWLQSGLGQMTSLFLLQGGHWMRHANLPYELYRGIVLVESGQLSMIGSYYSGNLYTIRQITPGVHTFKVTNDRYYVGQRPGRAVATATFDSQQPVDKNPPTMESLSLLVDGKITDTMLLSAMSTNRIRFRLEDALASVTLSCRVDSLAAWASLPLSQNGQDFEATIPDSVGYLSLRIEAQDHVGNRLTYTVEPAVRIDAVSAVGGIEAYGDADAGAARMTWSLPRDLPCEAASVLRTENGDEWTLLGTAPIETSGRVTFEDRSVVAGRRYGYRLAVTGQGVETLSEVMWLEIPLAFRLALAAAPNPSARGAVVRFTLPDARAARLEVLDLAGRLMLERAVGSFGSGAHVLDLSAVRSWPAGIYWVRLSREGQSVRRKVCVLQ